jgi:tetratricopeptide (TPR) repeat protein
MSKRRLYAAAFGSLLAINVCVFVRGSWTKPTERPQERQEPFFEDVGDYQRMVSTRSPIAQRYFSQGLAFLYSFNYEEADRSFAAAARADPQFAMANGPHVNNTTLDRQKGRTAFWASTKAHELADSGTAFERALVGAVGRRYADPPPQDRDDLDKGYSDAMREVRTAFPDDPDVGALTAEALLDLHPWAWWKPNGVPLPETAEAIQILRAVLRSNPRHPMALHMLVHAVEQGPHPEIAEDAAATLRDLAPGLDHLTHMPSHIDCRLGDWHDAVVANEKAIEADRKYRDRCFWPRTYHLQFGHNHHSLVYAAMMDGNRLAARRAAEELVSEVPPEFINHLGGFVQHYFSMPYEVHIRFGDWGSMLAEPEPTKKLPVTTALWRYGRALAFAATRRVKEAKSEQSSFLRARAVIPKDAPWGTIPAGAILDIAQEMMAGEILYREGKTADAVAALRKAVGIEDSLPYAEPARWVVPVRHALGATLMDARRYVEAELVYREDLKQHPKNGWALHGLMRSLEMEGKMTEALAVKDRFERAWQYADFGITSSCCCLPDRIEPSSKKRK